MLEVADLAVSYGQVRALHGVSLRVEAGQAVCVIGSNGAGKTTLLRTISGFLRPAAGTIHFAGRSLAGMPPHEVARLRIAHVPEGRHVFPDQTVDDNLLLGAWSRRGRRAPGASTAGAAGSMGLAAASGAAPTGIEADRQTVFDLFPRLADRRKQLAGTMSGGEQQMLAIGRALMMRPALMMLDEPSMGLAPLLIDEVFRRLLELKQRGLTMLLVEQLAYRALEVADHGFVIENGRIELAGPAAELRQDPRVRASYLGESRPS
jgi:branched-chain amino acid transport system ATP-binding protein